jgi:prepilin peptidase dependent protein B
MQRPSGFTLIELLIALALGLAAVGSGSGLLLSQLDAQRRQTLTSRLQQELRHALELIVRDLLRTGHWHHAGEHVPPASALTTANPYAGLLPASGTAGTLAYSYDRSRTQVGVQTTERYGWRLNNGTTALEMRLSGPALALGEGDAWQAVTDPGAVRIRAFSVQAERVAVPGAEACARACPTGATECPPQAWLQRVTVTLEGSAPQDPQQLRRLSASVQLRTPQVQGRCPL